MPQQCAFTAAQESDDQDDGHFGHLASAADWMLATKSLRSGMIDANTSLPSTQMLGMAVTPSFFSYSRGHRGRNFVFSHLDLADKFGGCLLSGFEHVSARRTSGGVECNHINNHR